MRTPTAAEVALGRRHAHAVGGVLIAFHVLVTAGAYWRTDTIAIGSIVRVGVTAILVILMWDRKPTARRLLVGWSIYIAIAHIWAAVVMAAAPLVAAVFFLVGLVMSGCAAVLIASDAIHAYEHVPVAASPPPPAS